MSGDRWLWTSLGRSRPPKSIPIGYEFAAQESPKRRRLPCHGRTGPRQPDRGGYRLHQIHLFIIFAGCAVLGLTTGSSHRQAKIERAGLVELIESVLGRPRPPYDKPIGYALAASGTPQYRGFPYRGRSACRELIRSRYTPEKNNDNAWPPIGDDNGITGISLAGMAGAPLHGGSGRLIALIGDHDPDGPALTDPTAGHGAWLTHANISTIESQTKYSRPRIVSSDNRALNPGDRPIGYGFAVWESPKRPRSPCHGRTGPRQPDRGGYTFNVLSYASHGGLFTPWNGEDLSPPLLLVALGETQAISSSAPLMMVPGNADGGLMVTAIGLGLFAGNFNPLDAWGGGGVDNNAAANLLGFGLFAGNLKGNRHNTPNAPHATVGAAADSGQGASMVFMVGVG